VERGRAAVALTIGLASIVLFPASCAGPESDFEPALGESATDLSFPGAPIILISVDTLRSDHLPAYGYRGVETPNIDGLRSDSVLFERAYAHSPLTLPSHVSMLTGTLPAEHGVRNNLGFVFDRARHPTIPSVLQKQGYATGAAVSAYVLRSSTGLGAVFDYYDDAVSLRGLASTGSMQRSGDHTVEVAERWIGERADVPFFFFLHLFEPHTPYDPPEPFRSRYPLAYDGEIAAADAMLGDFLGFLKTRSIYDRAVIVFLSDHGEGLSDHGEAEHGIFLYREAIQVPLLIKLPDGHRAGSTIERPAQLIDLLPTIAQLVGIGMPSDLLGRSLFKSGNASPESVGIVSETMYPRIHLGWAELWSLIEGRYHFVSAPRPELYDLVADPEERHNLIEMRADEAERMSVALAPFQFVPEASPHIDPAEAERLRALGYVGAAAAPATGPLPDPKDRITSLRLVGEATELAQAGRIDEALSRLRELLEVNPAFTDGWLQLARVSQRAGRFDEAIRAYENVIRIAPWLTAEAAASLATVYLRLNRTEEAEFWALRCVDSGSAAGHLLLGRVHLGRGENAAAVAEAKLAMEDSLYRVSGAVLLAEALVAQGRLVEALEVAEGAVDNLRRRHLDPVERLHMVRGDILGHLERYPEAEEAFLMEIESFPTNQLAYTKLAVVYYVESKSDLARATLERMVDANPHPISLLLAARTSRQLGDEQAAAAWQRRIEARQ
jgi:arylsulfatase A-like enzyme/lipopolysaccharide biosynthesis regulator YciM